MPRPRAGCWRSGPTGGRATLTLGSGSSDLVRGRPATSSPLGIEAGQARPNTMADIGAGKGGRRDHGAANSPTGGLCIYDMSAGTVEPTRVSIARQGRQRNRHRPAAATGGCVYVGDQRRPARQRPCAGQLPPRALPPRHARGPVAPLPGRSIVSGHGLRRRRLLYFGGGATGRHRSGDDGLARRRHCAPFTTPSKNRVRCPRHPLANGRYIGLRGRICRADAGDLLVVDPAGPDRPATSFTATGIEGSAVVVAPRWWFHHRLGVFYRQSPCRTWRCPGSSHALALSTLRRVWIHVGKM